MLRESEIPIRNAMIGVKVSHSYKALNTATVRQGIVPPLLHWTCALTTRVVAFLREGGVFFCFSFAFFRNSRIPDLKEQWSDPV